MIVNLGGGVVVVFVIMIYLFSNIFWDVVDLLFGICEVLLLVVVVSSSGSFVVMLFDDLVSGNWYLFVKVDVDSVVVEMFESNNVFLCGIKIGLDFRVIGFSVFMMVGLGDSIIVSELMINDGGGVVVVLVI